MSAVERKVIRLYREAGISRWEARTEDSKGVDVLGFGRTRRGAIRSLKKELADREERRAKWEGTKEPDEKLEVDW
jgi:hypothetical protein